jgi:hypothetical protein
MQRSLRTQPSAVIALSLAAALTAAPAAAHEVALVAMLDGAQAGSGSTATGTLDMQIDEHSAVFDVLSLAVDGIFVGDLDNNHGVNGTAIHVHLDAHGLRHEDPMLIDLGWYINAGFGTITPTATGFQATISGVLTGVQGLYDMQTETGLTPDDVFHEMEMGETYIIVHTASHPSGEIRGHITTPPVSVDAESWGSVKSRFQD